MFSDTLSFLSSRYVNDQVSHPYKTTGKINVLPQLLKLWICILGPIYGTHDFGGPYFLLAEREFFRNV